MFSHWEASVELEAHMTCPYAVPLPEPESTQVNQRTFFTRARRCVKDLQDHTYRACFNYDNPKAVESCDVKRELDRMEVSYATRSTQEKHLKVRTMGKPQLTN